MYRNLLYSITFIHIILGGCASYSPVPAVTVQPSIQTPPQPSPTHVAARAQRSEALLQALLSLGVDYQRGGNTPATGFDCSGLVAHVYNAAWGIRLPHSTSAQSKAGVPVSLAELQAGDLLFYDTLKRPYSHVGIYLGEGKFVHAPRAGAQVRIELITSAYWAQRFNGARRIEPDL
jgi:cell wall-associated NlpC family hydrolase